MVGFDLDGVLQPDLRYTKNFNLVEVNKVRTLMLPLYQPKGPWCIITSRSIEDKEEVATWVDKSFAVKPMLVVQCCEASEISSDYKARMLDLYDNITIYVESDHPTAVDIKRKMSRSNCEILSLSSLLDAALHESVRLTSLLSIKT